jgi:acetolactate synthase small subunit
METRRESVVRVLGVGTPGLLPGTAQVFSSVNVAVETYRLVRDADNPSIAIIEIGFLADERISDLICRKLSRLIDVVEVIPLQGFTDPGTEPDAESVECHVAHAGGRAAVV